MNLDWRFLIGLAGVVWIGYVFAGYPILLALVARFRRVHPVMSGDFLPSVSVLISARNEEKDIEWKVRETLAWDYPADELTVMVASDASDDRTDEILKNIDDGRLHYERLERRSGKSAALNRLVQSAPGELLFFTDANSHIDRGCLRRVARHFADTRVGCVTGNSNTRQIEEDGSGTAFYWGHELLIRHLENQFGSVLVCDGAIFCMRRLLYTPCRPEIANDLELPLRIGGAGFWLLHEPTAQVREKDTDSPWEELSRRRRICAQGALGMWILRDTLRGVRAWQFFSHKFLRWLLLVPMMMILISTMLLAKDSRLAMVLFAAQIACWGAAVAGLVASTGGRTAPKLLSVPVYFLVSSVGALAGVLEACAGRRFAVWESPALSRGDERAPS